MIVAAALCPPAPLLVPGLADDLADELRDLVRASRAAIAVLSGADRIVILSTGQAPGPRSDEITRLEPGATVSASAFSRSDHPAVPPVRLAGGIAPTTGEHPRTAHDVVFGGADKPADAHASAAGNGARRSAAAHPAAGTVVAAYLLHQAGITAPAAAIQLPSGSAVRVAGLAELVGHDVADSEQRIGLLVMANGSAAHSEHAPGGDDPRSPEFDRDLVTAVSSGDPALLSQTCERLAGAAAELHDDTLPALAALAALTADSGPASGELLHYSAPLGIGYLVASWRWA